MSICKYAHDSSDIACSECEGNKPNCTGYYVETALNAGEGTQAVEPIEYIPLAKTTVVRAESGVTVEIKGNDGKTYWYKVGFSEERAIPNSPEVNCDIEREALWETVNAQVDTKITEILEMFK